MALQNDRAESSLGDGLGILNRIPEEMRLKVFESLVPDHLPIGAEPFDLPLDTLDSRQTLLNLCLTSKKCYSLASPFLYRHVIITDHTQLASLLVTLMYSKERRAWIHRLAVLVEFERDGYSLYRLASFEDSMRATIARLKEYDIQNQESSALDIFNALGELLPQLQGIIEDAPLYWPPSYGADSPSHLPEDFIPLSEYPWDSYESDLNGVHLRLLQLLLQMQVNIKDILITVLPGFTHLLCPPETRGRIMDQFRLDPTQPSPKNPLNKLLSIRKRSEPNHGQLFNPDPLAPEYLGSKDWEFFKDSGKWFFDGFLDDQGWPRPGPPPSDLKIFSHITDLGLYKSKTHPAQLRVILSSCKSLKVFCYTTDYYKWSSRFRPVPSTDEEEGIPVPTLQQALDEVKETLTELRLGWAHVRLSLAAIEDVAPDKVDITGFPHLTRVDIDRAFDARLLSN